MTATIADLAALVGTVCPACKSIILRHGDGEVFCWDLYCGQQIDAYRAAAGRIEGGRTTADVVAYIAAGKPMHLLTNAELRLADSALIPEWDGVTR